MYISVYVSVGLITYQRPVNKEYDRIENISVKKISHSQKFEIILDISKGNNSHLNLGMMENNS